MYFDSLRKETMDSDGDLKIFPLVSGGGRGDEVSLSLDEFISKNGLVRWPRADIWTGVGAGMLWKVGLTSSFRKNGLARWPRADIWAGMWGAGRWGQSVLGRVHFGKWTRPMTASWYLGWNVGDSSGQEWGRTSSFRKNGLARWPRADIWAGMLVTSFGGPIRSEKMDSSNVAPEYGVRIGVDSSRGLSHDFSG